MAVVKKKSKKTKKFGVNKEYIYIALVALIVICIIFGALIIKASYR